RDDVRHHRAVLTPVLDDDECGIDREQPAPEQQRAFLAAPDRADLEVHRKIAIRMRRDVLDREVAYREQISKTNDRSGDAYRSAQRRIAAACDQFVVFEADSKQGCDD